MRKTPRTTRLALGAPGAALAVDRFWLQDAFDAEGFAAAVRLWTVALDLELGPLSRDRPVALTLSGGAELLVRRGLAYGAEDGRKALCEIQALAAAAALAASAELASELGPCPGWPEAGEGRLAAIQASHDACERRSAVPVVRLTRRLFTEALTTAAGAGLRNLQVTALFEDPSCPCAWAGRSLGGAPWGGALVNAEIGDGEIVQTLSAAAAEAWRVAGRT